VYQHNKVGAATITGYIAPDFCTKIPQQNLRPAHGAKILQTV
jgi:hypothetical protein